MKTKKILNNGEVICWYCKNSCDSNKCALYNKELRKKLKLRNTAEITCPCFVQDVPFPLSKDEVAQKCGLKNFQALRQQLTTYILAERRLRELEEKLMTFGYWGRYLKPLDYLTMTPREFFWKYMKRAYENYDNNHPRPETNTNAT